MEAIRVPPGRFIVPIESRLSIESQLSAACFAKKAYQTGVPFQGSYRGKSLPMARSLLWPMRTTRFESILNLQTARLLGIEVPPA
jgi:hypothetical protein